MTNDADQNAPKCSLSKTPPHLATKPLGPITTPRLRETSCSNHRVQLRHHDQGKQARGTWDGQVVTGSAIMLPSGCSHFIWNGVGAFSDWEFSRERCHILGFFHSKKLLLMIYYKRKKINRAIYINRQFSNPDRGTWTLKTTNERPFPDAFSLFYKLNIRTYSIWITCYKYSET